MTTTVRGRRGPKPTLSREAVDEAALDLVDSDGLAALNLRKLAARMGISPMTPYHYFSDKADLLSAMIGHALAPLAGDLDPGLPWDKQIDDAMHDLHAALELHPGVVELIIAESEGARLGSVPPRTDRDPAQRRPVADPQRGRAALADQLHRRVHVAEPAASGVQPQAAGQLVRLRPGNDDEVAARRDRRMLALDRDRPGRAEVRGHLHLRPQFFGVRPESTKPTSGALTVQSPCPLQMFTATVIFITHHQTPYACKNQLAD